MTLRRRTVGIGITALVIGLATLLFRWAGVVVPRPLPVDAVRPVDAPSPATRDLAVSLERNSAAAEQSIATGELAWIRGRVLDATDRAPIPGATIQLAAGAMPVARPPIAPVLSAADGSFCLPVAPIGRDSLEVRASGRGPRVFLLAGTGPRLDLGDVLMSEAAVASLRVVDAKGVPVSGAAVFWRKRTRAFVAGSTMPDVGSGLLFDLEQPTAVTAVDGRVALPEATFGTYGLLIVREGFRCLLRDVPIMVDSLNDLGTHLLEPAPPVEVALVREDGGVVHAAAVRMKLSATDSLALSSRGSYVLLPPPPEGVPRVDARADEIDGSFWGESDAAEPRRVILERKVPGVAVRWSSGTDADAPVTLWCFALQRGVLWEQASAARTLRSESWHCWPRRGPDVRFVAWSPRRGLGTASTSTRISGAEHGREAAGPLLQWQELSRRALRITVDGAPAADAVVVGEVELTDEVVGAAVGGTQRPRAMFTSVSDRNGIAQLGAVGGLRVSARVTLAGHPPVEVQLEPGGAEETTVRLTSGCHVVVRIADTPLLHRGMRIGIQAQGRPQRWFPVTGTEMHIEDLEPGPTDVTLEIPAEHGPALEPPVLDVTAFGRPDATIELDRVRVVVGPAPVWVQLSAAVGPVASLMVLAPRALRVAVTPVNPRAMPRQRAFVGSRMSAATRVANLYEGRWIVELLDSDLRIVWWREVDVSRTPQQLIASLPPKLARFEGGPASAQGHLTAQMLDGHTIPWLVVLVRYSSGVEVTAVPEGRYLGELATSDGTWRGYAQVEGSRVTLTASTR